jgi:Domain of unknown function (DUF3516)
LAGSEGPGGWGRAQWAGALAAYRSDHGPIGTGAEARSGRWFAAQEGSERWRVRQVLDDADGFHDAAILADIDLAASDEAGAPVWRTLALSTGDPVPGLDR